jgi:hypothetical protein
MTNPFALVGVLFCQCCGGRLSLLGETDTWIAECETGGCKLSGISWAVPTVALSIADPALTARAKSLNEIRSERNLQQAREALDFGLRPIRRLW